MIHGCGGDGGEGGAPTSVSSPGRRATTYPEPTDVTSDLIAPAGPHVIVLFGATGDLARRKLLPGLFHLTQGGLLPECRILGTAIDDLDDESFRNFVRSALEEFAHDGVPADAWAAFAPSWRSLRNRLMRPRLPSGSRNSRASSAATCRACTTSACRRPPRPA